MGAHAGRHRRLEGALAAKEAVAVQRTIQGVIDVGVHGHRRASMVAGHEPRHARDDRAALFHFLLLQAVQSQAVGSQEQLAALVHVSRGQILEAVETVGVGAHGHITGLVQVDRRRVVDRERGACGPLVGRDGLKRVESIDAERLIAYPFGAIPIPLGKGYRLALDARLIGRVGAHLAGEHLR